MFTLSLTLTQTSLILVLDIALQRNYSSLEVKMRYKNLISYFEIVNIILNTELLKNSRQFK